MGPLLVEFLDEVVELGLLLKDIGSSGPGGLLFEGQMHAFMTAVLLGMAGLDALDADAQPQPPDGKLGEVEEAVGGSEGDAIVGANGPWQATLLEEALKGSKRRHFGIRFHGLAQQQKAGGMIGDGERVAVAPVGEHELSLIVGAPEIVGAQPFR